MNSRIAIDALMEYTMPVTETGCWLWLGETQDDFGRICIGGEEFCADKLIWEIDHGRIPEGQRLLHTCNVRCCVNPHHLLLKENH